MQKTNCCIICGRTFDKLVVRSKEHIIPQAFGNKTLVTHNVCKDCNNKLGQKVDVNLTDFPINKLIRRDRLKENIKIIPDTLVDENGDKYRIRKDGVRVIPSVEVREGGAVHVEASNYEEAISVLKPKLKKLLKADDKQIEDYINNPDNIVIGEKRNKMAGAFSWDITLDIVKFKLAIIKMAYEYAAEKLGTRYISCQETIILREYLVKGKEGTAFTSKECQDIINRCHLNDDFARQFGNILFGLPKEVVDDLLCSFVCLTRDEENKLICVIRLLNEDALTFSVLLLHDANDYLDDTNGCVITVLTKHGVELMDR